MNEKVREMGRDRLLRVLTGEQAVARGEIWVSPEVLEKAGLPPVQVSLIDLALSLEADFCFFSWNGPLQQESLDEKELGQLVAKAHSGGLGCGVAVDGPFERLVKEEGFLQVMGQIAAEPLQFASSLRRHSVHAASELAMSEKSGADLLLLCDDVAYSGGLYFPPVRFEQLLRPLYQKLCQGLQPGTFLGFHSDGNLDKIIPHLVDTNFKLFSLEPEAMDLPAQRKDVLGSVVLASGLKAGWLTGDTLNGVQAAEIKAYIDSIKGNGGLLLCSACGLFTAQSLSRLQEIYSITGR